MDNLRRLGGIAGVVAGFAMAWLAIGLTVVFPAAGLSLKNQHDPYRYLPFIIRHETSFWAAGAAGGALAAIAAGVFILALADRFHDDSKDRARLGLALGLVGAFSLATGAFLRLTGFGYLATVYASTRVGGAAAFYAVSGVASSFQALADVSFGLAALIFGSMMLRRPEYTRTGYLSTVAGTPLIISAFLPGDVLVLIASGLTAIWLAWTGGLMWSETLPAERARGVRQNRTGVFRHAV